MQHPVEYITPATVHRGIVEEGDAIGNHVRADFVASARAGAEKANRLARRTKADGDLRANRYELEILRKGPGGVSVPLVAAVEPVLGPK